MGEVKLTRHPLNMASQLRADAQVLLCAAATLKFMPGGSMVISINDPRALAATLGEAALLIETMATALGVTRDE